MNDDDVDDRLKRVEWALWGVTGENGVVSEVRAIRVMLEADRVKRTEDQIQDSKNRLSGQRAIILALLAALIALIGTIASLVVALGG